MTIQLTKEQIDAIKVELRKYGLNVLPMPGRGKAKVAKPIGDSELNKRIARVSAMKFKTAGVKAAMLRSLKTLQRSRDYRAANPYDLTTILGWFGVKLQQVQPWPDFALAGSDQRWQALRNAHTMPVLRLPAPRPDWPHYVGEAFPMARRIEAIEGMASYKRMNIGVFPATETAKHA